MDKIQLCVGNNRDYSCYVHATLGEHCDKVRNAIYKYADLHAGHAGFHEDEINQLNFILQAGHTDEMRLPKHNECHLLIKRHSDGASPVYYVVIVASFLVVGFLAYRFREDLTDLARGFMK